MITLHDIQIDDKQLAEFCREKGIRELLFFGSITRADFQPNSDVDVLVRFEQGRAQNLFEFADVQVELSSLIGRPVHLHTDGMLPPKHHDYFLRGALRGYAA